MYPYHRPPSSPSASTSYPNQHHQRQLSSQAPPPPASAAAPSPSSSSSMSTSLHPPPPPPSLPASSASQAAPRQQTPHHHRASSSHSTASPEQTRSHARYPPLRDEYRQQYSQGPPAHNQQQQQQQQQQQHQQRAMPDYHDRSRSHGGEQQEDRGMRRPPWLDEHQTYGPPPHQPSSNNPSHGDRNMYSKPPQQIVHHHQQQQQAAHSQMHQYPGPPSAARSPSTHQQHSHYPTSFSHPPSPSPRPSTPPPQHYSYDRPAPWETSTQAGPMSAPPSLVPRMNPTGNHNSKMSIGNAQSTNYSGATSGPFLHHHTSPTLPGLMRGGNNKSHTRLPSWGSNSSNVNASGPSPAATQAPLRNDRPGAMQDGPGMTTFRGQSVGVNDPYARSDMANRDMADKRKRPASESPPNAAGPSTMLLQSSPSQRGDPMSMSSILGPSSRSGQEVDKRRRLDMAIPSAIPSSIKNEALPAPSAAATTAANQKTTATNVHDATVSNLARRKWSGAIAEEAAQHAAAWRAQEQQRWGASRSPKVGSVALAGADPRRTPPPPPASTILANSPGHKRQRSDGALSSHDSPLSREVALRPLTPPSIPARPSDLHESSPASFNQSLPTGMQRNNARQQQAPPPAQLSSNYHRGATPPTAPGQAAMRTSGPGGSVKQPYPPPSHVQQHSQANFQPYDGHGRMMEMNVADPRAMGNGSMPHKASQGPILAGPGMTGYDEGRQVYPAPTPVQQTGPPPSRAKHAPTSKSHHAHPNESTVARAVPARERERKPRSVTPEVIFGPAKGLLAANRIDKGDRGVKVQRPLLPSKDFNKGPKVDSEAVFEALREVNKVFAIDEGVVIEEGGRGAAAASRHLGNFIYDPRQSPLLPGDLLQANVGATVEIRVSGKHLGAGPSSAADDDHTDSGWRLGRGADASEKTRPIATNGGNTATVSSHDSSSFWLQDALVSRKVWGTDVYTDDSDVVAMCVHTGWIQGPRLDEIPSWVPPGKAMLAWRDLTRGYVEHGMDRQSIEGGVLPDEAGGRQANGAASSPARGETSADLSVVLRVAPKLIAYKGSQRNGVKSRSWGNGHDGVSLMIDSVTLKPAGYASGLRGLPNLKHRIDHLARLKTLATIAMDDAQDSGIDVKDKVQHGGLVDLMTAAGIAGRGQQEEEERRFWQMDNDAQLSGKKLLVDA